MQRNSAMAVQRGKCLTAISPVRIISKKCNSLSASEVYCAAYLRQQMQEANWGVKLELKYAAPCCAIKSKNSFWIIGLDV